MSIQLKEVTTDKELKAFIRFPFSIYRGNPYWVPALFSDETNSLRRDKNPAFEYCQARYWLAYKDDQLAGRIAAILNQRYIDIWGNRYMRFGWIDFIDDTEVSAALLGAVEDWARQDGMEAVHGPLGFTNMDHAGMLVEGFDELSTMATIYNHSYYPQHLERLGYGKDTDWVEYEIQVPGEPVEQIARVADIALRRNKLKLLRTSDKKELIPYARKFFRLYNEAYKDIYGAVPLTEVQIERTIEQYLGFMSPEFITVVLNEQNQVIAFGIVMPSLSRALQKAQGRLFPFGFIHLMRALRKNERGDLYLIAVKPEYQGRGVNAIVMDDIHRLFITKGITRIETNPELETNANVQGQWKYYEKRQHKRRRCFIKHLGAGER